MTALGGAGERSRDRARSTGSTSPASCSTPPRPSATGDRWVAERLPTGFRRRRQQDRPGRPQDKVLAQLRGRSANSRPRPTSRCRPTPATALDALRRPPDRPAARGPAVLPRRNGDRPRRGPVGRRAGARAAAGGHPRRAARTRSPPGSPSATGTRIRVEIIVERESQKGMVIGKGGLVLKQVGQRARRSAPDGHVPRAVRQGRQGLAAPSRPASSGFYEPGRSHDASVVRSRRRAVSAGDLRSRQPSHERPRGCRARVNRRPGHRRC